MTTQPVLTAHRTTHRLLGGVIALLIAGQAVSSIQHGNLTGHLGAEPAAPVTNTIEAQAWNAWDTLGVTVASDGLTPYRVEFEAASPNPLPPVTGTHVIEYDGVYYRFEVRYTEPQVTEYSADFGDVATIPSPEQLTPTRSVD